MLKEALIRVLTAPPNWLVLVSRGSTGTSDGSKSNRMERESNEKPGGNRS